MGNRQEAADVPDTDVMRLIRVLGGSMGAEKRVVALAGGAVNSMHVELDGRPWNWGPYFEPSG